MPIYADLLGLRPDAHGIAPIPGTQARLAVLPLGDGAIELLEPTEKDSPLGRYLERRGEGFYSLSVQVNNLQSALKNLQSKGIRPFPGETPHNAWLHPRDTHGMPIELTENSPQ